LPFFDMGFSSFVEVAGILQVCKRFIRV